MNFLSGEGKGFLSFLSFSLLRFVCLTTCILKLSKLKKIGDSSENLQRKTKYSKENCLILVINVQIKVVNSSALRLAWGMVVYYGSNLLKKLQKFALTKNYLL